MAQNPLKDTHTNPIEEITAKTNVDPDVYTRRYIPIEAIIRCSKSTHSQRSKKVDI